MQSIEKGQVFMKKLIFTALFFIIASLNSFSQDVIKPRIAVFPLINPSEDPQVDIISGNVKKTAELTLKMIDMYEVVDADVSSYENSSQWFTEYASRNSIDSIIFGKAVMNDDGSILLEMSVFSRTDNDITITENETAETVFDIFDASDRLLISMMETFSGLEHIGFGNLRISNKGEEGRYSVFIDNVLIGENVEELPKVLNGDRVVRIEQNRMLGLFVVAEEKIFLRENEQKVLEFSIPGFTEGELLEISSLENFIDKNWDKKYSSKKIDKNFEKLSELFSVTDYSKSARIKKTSILDKKEDWNDHKKKWGIEKGLSILDKRLGIAGFFGANISFPDFSSSIDPDADSGNEIGQKYGGSVSFNILKHLALQAEYNYTEYRAKIERPLYIDTTTVDLQEIPIILLLRMPNKVMSAYGGISFMKKIGDAVQEREEIATGDITTITESGDNMVETDGTAFIMGALFEIPMNRIYLMIDFRYSSADDDWSKDPNEELFPGYMSMTAGLGLKFF